VVSFIQAEKGWIIFILFCLILTPIVFELAYIQRGYEALGGEIFFPFSPLLLRCLVKTITDCFKEIKREVETCNVNELN